MRVVAGRWRGRRLKSPPGDRVRPTTDRVKEALFSMLGREVEDAVVVDLCCGAGGLAVEALSRGASRAILVDSDRRSLDLARANLDLCGADPGTWDLVRATAETWLAQWTPLPEPYLVLADPPYQSMMLGTILDLLADLATDPNCVAAVLEHGPDFRPEMTGAAGFAVETRRYGSTCLTILRPTAGGGGKE